MDEQVEENSQRKRLDRLDGCFMWGFGMPIVGIVVAALVAVVWAWGIEGPVSEWLKWTASIVIVVVVGTMTWLVLRTKRE